MTVVSINGEPVTSRTELTPQQAVSQIRYTLERLKMRGGEIHPREVQSLLDILPLVEQAL